MITSFAGRALQSVATLAWAGLALTALTARGEAQTDSSLVAKGEYLARAGDCISCHTAPGGKPYAGGLEMDTPFGKISTPNLTPDKQTGIGNWSDDEFYRAIHEGIGKQGEYLYPVFPFPWYTRVTREDALAIKAYLFSLAPENAPRKPFSFAFPFNIRQSLAAWRLMFFKPGGDKPLPTTGDQRGAYLVEGLGHCGECHNQHNVMGASQWSGKLEGGEIQGWFAPNLTADGKEGVGRWNENDLVTFLKTGTAPGHGVALGPMKETIDNSLRFLNDQDLHAIAAYLKSVPGEKTYRAEQGSYYTDAHAPGADVYLGRCASCHQPDGKGVPGVVPALVGNGAVLARGAENVARVVLGGLPASKDLGPMPAVGASMNDRDIADVINYVRQSWGNTAPANADPGLIGKLRAETKTLHAGNAEGGCPAIADARLAGLVDPAVDTIAKAKPSELLPAIDAALAKLKQADSSITADAATNAFTASYCRVVLADAKLTQPARAERIGNFATLVYTQFRAPAVK